MEVAYGSAAWETPPPIETRHSALQEAAQIVSALRDSRRRAETEATIARRSRKQVQARCSELARQYAECEAEVGRVVSSLRELEEARRRIDAASARHQRAM